MNNNITDDALLMTYLNRILKNRSISKVLAVKYS